MQSTTAELCDEFDMLLGKSFLVAHKAVLANERRCASVTRSGKKYSLRAFSWIVNRRQTCSHTLPQCLTTSS